MYVVKLASWDAVEIDKDYYISVKKIEVLVASDTSAGEALMSRHCVCQLLKLCRKQVHSLYLLL